MTAFEGLVLFVSGLTGGALSAAAGGASFVTFPALILTGLSPLAANTTNFVGLITAQPTALATSYRSELRVLGRRLIPSLATALVGGIAGAELLLHTGESGFSALAPWLMLLATSMFAAGPTLQTAITRAVKTPLHGNSLLCQAFIFLFSVYCGYFGAGVGMMLLGVLAVFGYDDIHQANAVKNAVVMISSMVATVIYGLSGPVAWPAAFVLIAGATLGAYAGGVIAKRAPQHLLRIGLIGLGAIFTIYLFWR